MVKLGKNSLHRALFKFSTYNNDGVNPSPSYLKRFGKVHRKSQKYVIELFSLQGHNRRFFVFEDVSIIDQTLAESAVVETSFGNIKLSKLDLRSIFRFFKGLQTANASRNSTITSGVMEVSGGSRMNYRSNIDMNRNIKGSNNALYELDINEG